MRNITWPMQEQFDALRRTQAALEESYRVLRLPYWPRDYFPPSVPYVGPVKLPESRASDLPCASVLSSASE